MAAAILYLSLCLLAGIAYAYDCPVYDCECMNMTRTLICELDRIPPDTSFPVDNQIDFLSIECRENKPYASFIDKDTINHWDNLTYLFFEGCLLEFDDMFPVLPSLKEIFLRNNRFKELPGDLFASLTKLERIAVQFNSLTTLSSSQFWWLFELRKIELDRNRINTLPSNLFEDNMKLQEIILDYNEIETISPQLFQYLPELTLLSVSYNRLRHVEAMMFPGLTRLKMLRLDHNKIHRIDSDAFQYVYLLETLYLQGNKIRELPSGLFSGMTLLKSVHLEDNYISTVPGEMLQSLMSLSNMEVLNLCRNPLDIEEQDIQDSSSGILMYGKTCKKPLR